MGNLKLMGPERLLPSSTYRLSGQVLFNGVKKNKKYKTFRLDLVREDHTSISVLFRLFTVSSLKLNLVIFPFSCLTRRTINELLSV